MKYQLRIPYVNIHSAEWGIGLQGNYSYPQSIAQLRAMSDADSGKLRQRRMSMIATQYKYLGMNKYAIGSILTEVREAFSGAVAACVEVFRLRGTQDVFPVYDLVVDPSKRKGDPARSKLTQRHPPGEKDFSNTNSKDGFWHTCLALGIGEEDRARELAAMIWDPPDADYLGNRSVVCTPNDQALGYALRDFLAGKDVETHQHLHRIRALPDDPVWRQAQMLKAIIDREVDTFKRELDDLLWLHERHSRRAKADATLYICVPALGLSMLAVSLEMVSVDDLPAANVYLPVELFATRNMRSIDE